LSFFINFTIKNKAILGFFMSEKGLSPIQQNKKAAASPQQKVDNGTGNLSFNDSRAEAVSLKAIQAAADESDKLKKITQLQGKAGSTQRVLTQLQEKANQSSQNDPIQRKSNNTGLPDNLKTGIESISGISMDSVKVHKNSDKPAQLNAHAYAQGTDIHLGAGQEKHLPHEAWHVVQQSQGRVQPTTQMAGVNINDNSGLEKEADVMGAKALQTKSKGSDITQLKSSLDGSSDVAQMAGIWKRLTNFFGGKKPDEERLLGSSSLSDEVPDEDVDAAPASPIEQEGAEIEAGPFTYQDGEITIEVWPGQKFSFGKGSVAGTLPSKSFDMDIGSLEASVDIPFAPGAYATVSLGITPNISLSIDGGTFTIGNKSLAIKGANITGSMGLDITAKVGAGVGVANVVGLDAGGFATLGASADLGGNLEGTVDFRNKKYDVNLSVNANADIVGNAGVFIQAKALGFSVSKKWILAQKKFAHFSYMRGMALTGRKGDWSPKLSDFRKIEYGDHSKQNFLETDEGKIYSNDPDYNQRTPLLAGTERSDG
jgi:hypothetical protein